MLERPSIPSRFAWLYSCSFVRLLPRDELLLPLRARLRLDEPVERLRDLLEPVERFVPLDLLLVPEDDERARERPEPDPELERDRVEPDRERCPDELGLPPLFRCCDCCCRSPLPLSLPSSFFPTATAAGT